MLQMRLVFPIVTARRWVREHLGEEAYQGALLRRGVQSYSPEIKEAAREMWSNRMTAKKIQQKLSEDFDLLEAVNTQMIYMWCIDVPRLTDSSDRCYGTNDMPFVRQESGIPIDEKGPSDDDLRAIEEMMKEGMYDEGF